MTIVKVLVGVAGVGKSTYIQKVKTEKSLVLSSDELRIELFGDLEAGNAPEAIPVVFKTLHERMKEALLSKQYDTIFYDATNLSRKLRKGFYEQFKKYAEIETVVLVKPLATILEQNAQRVGFANVPESVFAVCTKACKSHVLVLIVIKLKLLVISKILKMKLL